MANFSPFCYPVFDPAIEVKFDPTQILDALPTSLEMIFASIPEHGNPKNNTLYIHEIIS